MGNHENCLPGQEKGQENHYQSNTHFKQKLAAIYQIGLNFSHNLERAS
jgi:hypothetical protein